MSKMMNNLDRVMKDEDRSLVLRLPALFLNKGGGVVPNVQSTYAKKRAQQKRALILSAAGAGVFALLLLLVEETTGVISRTFNPPAEVESASADPMLVASESAAQMLRAGQFAEAESAYRAAMKTFPRALHFRVNLAYALKSQKKYREAEAVLNGLLFEKPSHAQAHNNLGVIYLEMGRYEAAKEQLRLARAAAEDYTDAALNLAVVYEKTGNWDGAVEIYKDYIANPQADRSLASTLKERLRRVESLSTVKFNQGDKL